MRENEKKTFKGLNILNLHVLNVFWTSPCSEMLELVKVKVRLDSQGLKRWLLYGAHVNFLFYWSMIYTLDVMLVSGRNKQNEKIIALHLMNLLIFKLFIISPHFKSIRTSNNRQPFGG